MLCSSSRDRVRLYICPSEEPVPAPASSEFLIPTDNICAQSFGKGKYLWKATPVTVCAVLAAPNQFTFSKLFDAFDTRFRKINLRYYSKAEIAEIVKIANPEWDDGICKLVSRYGGLVPREALSFAHEMKLEREMSPNSSWKDIAWVIAQDHEIDKLGMSIQRLNILKTLSVESVSKSRMADVAGCKEEELVKFIMPPLMAKTPDQEPMVTITSKGYTITDSGLRQLEIRKQGC